MRNAFSIVLLAAPLLAQGPADPLRFVPHDAVAVLRARGPAGWRDLAGTGIGKAMANAAKEPKWRRSLLSIVEQMWPEERRAQGNALIDLLLDYQGEVVLTARVDWDGLGAAIAAQRPPPFCAALVLAGDGTVDLAELTRALAALLPPGGERELQLGGATATVRDTPYGDVTVPTVRDGCVVVLLGSDLAAQAGTFLDATGPRLQVDADARRGTFGLQIECAGLTPHLAEVLELAAVPDAALAAALLDVSGLGSVRRVVANLYADGAMLAQDVRCDFDGSPRGFFDLMMPVRDRTPALLPFLPATSADWTASAYGVAAVRAIYEDFFARHADAVPMSREAIEAEFTKFTKLRLFEDVVDLIGDEFLWLDDSKPFAELEAEDEEQARSMAFGDSCVLWQLRDAKRFAQNLDKAVRARGLHVGRKSEQHGDTTIYRLLLLGTLQVEYAITDSMLVLGVGGDGPRHNLRSILSAIAARKAGQPAPPLPDAVQARLQALPAGWASLEAASAKKSLDEFAENFTRIEQMLIESDIESESFGPWLRFAELLRGLQPELVRHGVDVAVTAEYFVADRYLLRWRW